MKHLIAIILSIVVILSGCSREGAPAHKRYSLEQFLDTTTFTGGSFSYDENRILFSSNETGIFNAYALSVRGAFKENKAAQLTNSTNHSVYALSFFPEDDRILFEEDVNGDEISHIYLREANGMIRDLTPGNTARAEFYGWTHDYGSFLYGTNSRDARFMDIYEMDIETFEPKLLFKNEEGYQFGCLSPNKRYMALSKTVSKSRTDIYLYDLETESGDFIPNEGTNAAMVPQTFSPDSNNLYYLTDEGYDFTFVKRFDLLADESHTVYKEQWDIDAFAISHLGTYDILTINEEARHTVKIFSHAEKKPLKLPENLNSSISRAVVSRSEKLILFAVNNDTSPTNFYLFNIEKNTAKQLTESLSPLVDASDLVVAKHIRFRASDGLAIPAVYYQPKEASKTHQVPALIWVHGGPGGQSNRHYNYLIQYLVNQGYAILAVNNRGSSGYGKHFYALADRKHGEIDLQDCLDAKEYLINTGVVAPDKIGMIGGSYGGFMTLAALAFKPDEMAVGIDLFGVSNWARTLESIPSWWASEREILHQKIGHPQEDRNYLESISPLFHADKIKKPLMVLQGANDPRVLKIESDEIIGELENSSVPYRYVIFSDEGHGFTKDRNKLIAGKAIHEFLKTHLNH